MVRRMLSSDRDAQDAIQEVMLKLWQKRSQLSNHPNRTGFVFLTARNHCLDILKKKKLPVVYDDVLPLSSTSCSGHENYKLQELVKVIDHVLKNCDFQHKEILFMRDLDGMSYDEIAEVTQLKITHIRVIVSRTRKFVQEELKKNYNYE